MLLCAALVMLAFASYAGAISGTYNDSYDTTTGIANGAGTGINNTVHDLRRANSYIGGLYKSNPDDALDRLCIFCHAPHHTYRLTTAGAVGTGPLASAQATYLPLWNHTITNAIFTPYKNGPDQPLSGPKHAQSTDPLLVSQGTFDKIGATSLLCLSCHDGTVAVNEYGHSPQSLLSQSSGGVTMTPQYNIGAQGYLANHHPIGFLYDVVASLDPEIYNSNVATFDQSYDGGSNQIPVANLLAGGKMECSTCHAVHNTGNTGEKLLYVSDKNSNLCLSCHAKGWKTAPITAAP
jgi:predicted CXXCH cytochrome family protein